MSLIDSHAHLAEERFDGDRGDVLQRARDAGIEAVVVIGYDLPSSRAAVDLAVSGPKRMTASSPALFATTGFAPHNVADADDESMATVRAMLGQDRVVGVGEIGLDYHYDMPRPEQRRVFGRQLEWAVEASLPVVIHSREAEHDVVAMLRDAGAHPGAHSGAHAAQHSGPHGDPADPQSAVDGPRLGGVIHCFTESATMAAAVVDLGLYVSFSGILTFPSAGELRATAASVPLERTLIETDAPYLAPQPFRGKRNEPAFVGAVADCLAEIHGCGADEVATRTSANARRLFGLPGSGK